MNNFGEIYIAANNWQSGTVIKEFDGTNAYFKLFGEECKCDLYNKVVYHLVDYDWVKWDRASDIHNIYTPCIVLKEK